MNRRRVYIRGVGAITALANSWRGSVPALARGESAVTRIRQFDTHQYPCQVAAAIQQHTENTLTHTGDRRGDFLHCAATELWRDAAIVPEKMAGHRLGIFLGAESGRAPFATVAALTRAAGGGTEFDHHQFGEQARALATQFNAATVSPAAVTSALAGEYGAKGPAVTISLACASSAVAIAEAARAIEMSVCDYALCGGVGADVDPLMLVGFGKLGALSMRGLSCPFDLRRDGFVVGEGAALMLLSSERGNAVAEIAGHGRSLDAFNLTAPDPNGNGAARAMASALQRVPGQRIDYVQAHGTSTPLNDAIETLALQRTLGTNLDHARVASVKGALGHWIAGAGALACLCAYEAVANGCWLPTANLDKPDPVCALPHLAHAAVFQPARLALANAFAFGGANCSVLIQRLE